MDPSHPSNEEANSENTNNNNTNSLADDHVNFFDEDHAVTFEEALGQDLVGIMDMLTSFSEIDNGFELQNPGVRANNNNDIAAFMEEYLNNIPNVDLEDGGRLRDIRRAVTDALTEVMVNNNNQEEEEEDPRAIVNNNRRATRPASESAIQGLEKVTVVIGEKDEKGKCNECSICFENFSNDPEASRMPCSHLFHTKCIYGWLHTCNTCPLCRFELPTGDAN